MTLTLVEYSSSHWFVHSFVYFVGRWFNERGNVYACVFLLSTFKTECLCDRHRTNSLGEFFEFIIKVKTSIRCVLWFVIIDFDHFLFCLVSINQHSNIGYRQTNGHPNRVFNFKSFSTKLHEDFTQLVTILETIRSSDRYQFTKISKKINVISIQTVQLII